MNYKADLINYNNVVTKSITGKLIGDLKNDCKLPGFNYIIKIYAIYDNLPEELVITYHYKNNKFYKL